MVDAENRLVGIVTVDDAMDVMEEETTEDIELMTVMASPFISTIVDSLSLLIYFRFSTMLLGI